MQKLKYEKKLTKARDNADDEETEDSDSSSILAEHNRMIAESLSYSIKKRWIWNFGFWRIE